MSLKGYKNFALEVLDSNPDIFLQLYGDDNWQALVQVAKKFKLKHPKYIFKKKK